MADATALGIGQFLSFCKRFRSYLHAVEVFSGALLFVRWCADFYEQVDVAFGKVVVSESVFALGQSDAE